MTKDNIEFAQFSLAPRRLAAPASGTVIARDARSTTDVEGTPDTSSQRAGSDDLTKRGGEPLLQRLSDNERREKSARHAAERQEARRKLKDLKRGKERNVRFYVNVPLDQDAKRRLQRAAHENDVHMTVIMQAAIDTYLKDNGY